ncbi:NUC1 [Candida jiufengensis]|uniref:NUC1 n=1 Tax=Candida jiufengensis TaxID=497108 RepID=UPI0022246B3D|nr:NUC1 [Candida jiufengensis]KAI5956396.1 NUC1 [Candida jiufengensis]
MSRLILKSSLGLGSLGIASYFWGLGGNKSNSSPSTPLPPSSSPPNSNSNLPIKPPSTPTQQQVFDPSSINPEAFFKYGFPGPIHDLSPHSEFISCYDRSKRNPYWVVEHLTKQSLAKSIDNGDRKKSIFKEDESIPAKFRNKLRDYFRSGYDRGHQAPAADAKFNQLAIDETFLLTNISPQVGDGFNRDYWSHFEDFIRRLTTKYDDIRVMTGPLYLPKLMPDGKYRVSYEVIGSPPNIAVPTHFFKLVVGEKIGDNQISCAAFVLPNDIINNNTPLIQFQVPIDALERSSGLELLQKIPYYNKKDLCKEVKCEIIVREFPKQVNNVLALPSGGK